MNEGDVRQMARLAALQAEMNAELVYVEGMKATNTERLGNGLSVAYTMNEFHACSARLQEIADQIRKEI